MLFCRSSKRWKISIWKLFFSELVFILAHEGLMVPNRIFSICRCNRMRAVRSLTIRHEKATSFIWLVMRFFHQILIPWNVLVVGLENPLQLTHLITQKNDLLFLKVVSRCLLQPISKSKQAPCSASASVFYHETDILNWERIKNRGWSISLRSLAALLLDDIPHVI